MTKRPRAEPRHRDTDTVSRLPCCRWLLSDRCGQAAVAAATAALFGAPAAKPLLPAILNSASANGAADKMEGGKRRAQDGLLHSSEVKLTPQASLGYSHTAPATCRQAGSHAGPAAQTGRAAPGRARQPSPSPPRPTGATRPPGTSLLTRLHRGRCGYNLQGIRDLENRYVQGPGRHADSRRSPRGGRRRLSSPAAEGAGGPSARRRPRAKWRRGGG